MITDEQISRIARASGFKNVWTEQRSTSLFTEPKIVVTGERGGYREDVNVSASLDAIQAAVMGQSEAWQDIFDDELYDILSKSNTKRFRHQLTPAQWCLAFIATLDTIEAKQEGSA